MTIMNYALLLLDQRNFLIKNKTYLIVLFFFYFLNRALKDADLVIVLGARLNWMLHFGQSPRFSQDVKIVQVYINAEDLGNNTKNCFQIQPDIKSFCKQVMIKLI